MTSDQAIVFATLGGALLLFVVGRWRYDVVAVMALLAVTLAGTVDAGEAFTGFGHPAVITVGAVLIVSRGLQNSGVVDSIARWMTRVGESPTAQVGSLSGLVAVFSSFMNNVGAMALLMPVAIQMAGKAGRSPSILLMPLAFGSLLGGLITLIGTPPNIIIATFRAENGGEPFRMFDFAPVGLGVAVVGVAFIAFIGWRLVPQRAGAADRRELFRIDEYISEVSVRDSSKMADKPLRDLERASDSDVVVVGIVRDERTLLAPSGFEIVRPDDVLIVEADSEALKSLVDDVGLELVGSPESARELLGSEEVSLVEAVVTPNSLMEGQTPATLSLRWRYGVNLIAVARHGGQLRERLRSVRFRAGDVVLLQGSSETLPDVINALGCLPLAERGLSIGQPRRIALALAIFVTALVAAAAGLVEVQVAFIAAALAMVIAGLLSLQEAYEAIDWSIIVLLAAMIPVGLALESTGGAQLVADQMFKVAGDAPPELSLALLLVATMFLSDLVNNAAAAILMAPIAVSTAGVLEVSSDPFLMAVAVGASSAFLTPIGHQSNTLVMGPGGYRFGDYWRLGLPVEALIVAVSLPLILLVWPL